MGGGLAQVEPRLVTLLGRTIDGDLVVRSQRRHSFGSNDCHGPWSVPRHCAWPPSAGKSTRYIPCRKDLGSSAALSATAPSQKRLSVALRNRAKTPRNHIPINKTSFLQRHSEMGVMKRGCSRSASFRGRRGLRQRAEQGLVSAQRLGLFCWRHILRHRRRSSACARVRAGRTWRALPPRASPYRHLPVAELNLSRIAHGVAEADLEREAEFVHPKGHRHAANRSPSSSTRTIGVPGSTITAWARRARLTRTELNVGEGTRGLNSAPSTTDSDANLTSSIKAPKISAVTNSPAAVCNRLCQSRNHPGTGLGRYRDP
jgi:hypothetical protein